MAKFLLQFDWILYFTEKLTFSLQKKAPSKFSLCYINRQGEENTQLKNWTCDLCIFTLHVLTQSYKSTALVCVLSAFQPRLCFYRCLLWVCVGFSAHTTPWQHLLFAYFAEELEVLVHGVHAVSWSKETFCLAAEDGGKVRDIGAQKTLHELPHQVPTVTRNHTS